MVTGGAGGESWRWEADGGGGEGEGREAARRRGEGASTGWWRWRGREGIEQQRRRGSGAASSHGDGDPAGAGHTSALTGTVFASQFASESHWKMAAPCFFGEPKPYQIAPALGDRVASGFPGFRELW